jgi:hypothetical protein
MIFEILTCAMDNKTSSLCSPGKAFPKDPLIVYINRERRYFVTLNGVTLLSQHGCPSGVHYYISDNCDMYDTNIGSILTMGISSDKPDCPSTWTRRQLSTCHRSGWMR